MKRTPRKKQGLFLTFEGGEGAGKSTQARLLHAWLTRQGIPALLTRQPGGSEIGQKLRQLVLDSRTVGLSPRAELLIYEADRAQHVDEVLRPALDAGQVVLCDRYTDSSLVYQGMCRKLGLAPVNWLNRYATAGLKPDAVILMDIPHEDGLARVRARGGDGFDRIEKEAAEFHRQVRAGFLKLARASKTRFQVYDARKPEQQIAEKLRAWTERKLKQKQLWPL